MPDQTYKQNVVLITGASRGIGKAMALELAEAGAYLVLSARDEATLELVAEECERVGETAKVRTIIKRTDVTNPADCEDLVKAAVNEYGRLDTLINNAGQTMWSNFHEVTDLSIFEKVMQVNYLGSVYTTHYALPHLIESKGRLVAVSSLAGKTGVPARSGYAASKHAVAGFFDSLRIELADTGVTVTVGYPGFVKTDSQLLGFGGDGQPLGHNPVDPSAALTPEEVSSEILKAALGRKRQVLIGSGSRSLLWGRLLAPKRVDAMARKAIETGKLS